MVSLGQIRPVEAEYCGVKYLIHPHWGKDISGEIPTAIDIEIGSVPERWERVVSSDWCSFDEAVSDGHLVATMLIGKKLGLSDSSART